MDLNPRKHSAQVAGLEVVCAAGAFRGCELLAQVKSKAAGQAYVPER